MQRQTTFGGGVSPRGTLLRGQSIIEYVLIITVIGLVIVFAGPGVAGAIRNQFNLVGNTLNSGTNGTTEGGGASGGGSTGADSATVQAAIAKDAKDWTLDEQKAVAEDIATKGEASAVWSKAKAAMDAGTEFSMKLTDGQTLTYCIIGMNHDDLADGSGKAGLTFLATSRGIQSRMNAAGTNAGGWEKSELRQKMNSGEIWNLMPSDFQSKVKSVTKLTNNSNSYSSTADIVTATSDKLFLLSFFEIVGPLYDMESKFPWVVNEGTQYEAFKGKVSTFNSSNSCLSNGGQWWQRSMPEHWTISFYAVTGDGNPSGVGNTAAQSNYVCPAWCF